MYVYISFVPFLVCRIWWFGSTSLFSLCGSKRTSNTPVHVCTRPKTQDGWGDTGVSSKTDEGIGKYLVWLGGLTPELAANKVRAWMGGGVDVGVDATVPNDARR